MSVTTQNYLPSKIIIGLSLLQIIFIIVVGSVTKAELDQGRLCQLNVDPETGRVCDFVYSTVGFGAAFSLVLGGSTLWSWTRRRPGPVTAGATIGLATYSFFWWLVFSITIAIRGGQATDAGQPGTSDRNAVVGLSWIVTIAYLAIALLSIWERHINKIESDLDKSFLKKEESFLVKKVSGSDASGGSPKEGIYTDTPQKQAL